MELVKKKYQSNQKEYRKMLKIIRERNDQMQKLIICTMKQTYLTKLTEKGKEITSKY